MRERERRRKKARLDRHVDEAQREKKRKREKEKKRKKEKKKKREKEKKRKKEKKRRKKARLDRHVDDVQRRRAHGSAHVAAALHRQVVIKAAAVVISRALV